MFKNYLKFSFRNLLRQKTYSIVNILGLALGLSCCIIIFKFVLSEVGYDAYHPHGDRLYRVTTITEMLSSGERWNNALSSILWGPAMKKDFPEVENFSRIVKAWEPMTLEMENIRYQQDNVYYAENSLFDLFNWELVAGDVKHVFDTPYSIVMTERTAKKYFGEEPPLGKQMTLVVQERNEIGQSIERKISLTISAIMADVHPKTHLKPEILVSFITLNDFYGGDVNSGTHPDQHFWRWTLGYTYLLLQQGSSPTAFEQKLPEFINKYIGDANIARGFHYLLYLQPVAGIHLEKNIYSTPEPGGNKDQLYLFSIISIFVLLIACFNFMNLETARSGKRSVEVGVRKVIGAKRNELIFQFLLESMVISLIAIATALMLTELITPIFSYYTGKKITLLPEEQGLFIGGLIGITFLSGIFAGGYPALFLSSFRPAAVLKKAYHSGKKGIAFRKTLVIVQFVITVCFIVATITAKDQISFMKTKHLGFDSSRIIVLPPGDASTAVSKLESVRNELLNGSHINNTTYSNNVPGRMYSQDIWKQYQQQDKAITPLYEIETDYDFIDVYGLQLIAGRKFSKEMATDAKSGFTNVIPTVHGLMPTTTEASGSEIKPQEIAVILNEEGVQRLGLGSPEEAISKVLVRDPVSVDFLGVVIGVVRDFHFESLQRKIEPLVIYLYDQSRPYSLTTSIKISNSHAISSIKKIWSTHFPDLPFEYFFIDENFARQYQQEEKILDIFGYMSLFAIFIAGLGLFGLTLFISDQKTKEIGIRKVLGATISNVVVLLTKDFIKMVFIAYVIGCPIAYLAMRRWLQNFAYQTDLGLWIFLTAGLITLMIVLMTVSFQALRAAVANPVDSLQYE